MHEDLDLLCGRFGILELAIIKGPGGSCLWLLIDPVKLSVLVRKNFTLAEPKINLFLSILNTIGAMADVTADILTPHQRIPL